MSTRLTSLALLLVACFNPGDSAEHPDARTGADGEVLGADAGADAPEVTLDLTGTWNITSMDTVNPPGSCASIVVDPTSIEVTPTQAIYYHANCPENAVAVAIVATTEDSVTIEGDSAWLSDCESSFYETMAEHTITFDGDTMSTRIETQRAGGGTCMGVYQIEGVRE